LLPAGAVAGWGLHPLESAAFSRRTPKADIRPLIVSGPAMATMQKLHLPPMPKRLLASVDGIGQRSLIVSAGAAVAGAVACLDTAPAPLATLIGVCGRRAMQNASTASVTAVLISA